MWTTRRIKLAIAGAVLLSAGLMLGFVVGRVGSGEQKEEAPKKVAEVPQAAGVSVPEWNSPPPPVSAGTVAAQQVSPPTYIEVQPVQQPQMVPVYVQQVAPQVVEQQRYGQPQEDYWSGRPVGRNGLIGNPSVDPPSSHGQAYSRAY